MSNKITYYYQQIENDASSSADLSVFAKDDIKSLIDLHIKSFERLGWEVVVADENTARQHPLYDLFNDPTTALNKSSNAWPYTRACYMRWLAYAVMGHSFADFDVINYDFTPQDAEDVKSMYTPRRPTFLSYAGAIGLFDAADYEKLLNVYVDFIRSPKIEGLLSRTDVNDMTIMLNTHPQWYNNLPEQDVRVCKDYTCAGWEKAKLVHYAYHYTKLPRVETINAARRPF